MHRLKGINRGLFLVFFFLCLAGCSAQSKDKFLRTVFDGVPTAEKEEPLKKQERQEKKQAPAAAVAQDAAIFFHQPFLEKHCDACHESKFSQRLIAKGKELCFTCHDDFTKDKKVVHYPVSQGECAACHDPHQSLNKFILKNTLPQLCFSCHEEKDVKSDSVHAGQDKCLDCHNPHTSNEEKLLK